MFSDVRSRLQRAESLRFPFARSGSDVTEPEVSELKTTVGKLRKQLQQIVVDEIAPNNEACGVATNGMVLLRNEMDEKRLHRDESRGMLDEAKSELARVESQCTQEKEKWDKCRDDAARMKEDTEKARKDAINLRAEMDQITYFQENVDTETMYRLRADVQNLKTEQERDEIRLRHLNTERNDLQSELEKLQALRDAHQLVATEQQRELSETKMTRDMYRAHQEALTGHLHKLGGDPRNKFGGLGGGLRDSVKGFFKGQKMKELLELDEIYSERSFSKSKVLPSQKEEPPQEDLQRKQHERPKPNKEKSERSKQHPQVGGVVFGADTAEGSSDFLRKLPTIFKMGANTVDVQDYMVRKEREVEFSTDSNSISAISAITIDEDAWTLSDTEE